MNIDKNLFDKYSNIKIETYPVLFPDFTLPSKGHCPYCFNKLYEMRNKPLLYCKSKKHKRFIYKIYVI